MIKLIATDIDGTLISEGTDKINPELYDIVRELKTYGVVFAAASGREYDSIYRVFEPIKDDMIFVAQNGAFVMCRGVEISRKPIRRSVAEELIGVLRQRDDCQFQASAPEGIYLDYRDEYYLNVLTKGYKNNITFVDDVTKVDTDYVKISIFQKDGITEQMKRDMLVPRWQDRLQVVVSGTNWIDFMNPEVDKGNAVATIQKVLNIGVDETMAFGDNNNDIGMLRRAKYSYAVANASDNLKEVANYVAKAGPEDGVVCVLKRLLEAFRDGKAEEFSTV